MFCYKKRNLFTKILKVLIFMVRLTRPLPNDKIQDQSKFKAFADDKIYFDKRKIKLVLGMVENIVEKGENASY